MCQYGGAGQVSLSSLALLHAGGYASTSRSPSVPLCSAWTGTPTMCSWLRAPATSNAGEVSPLGTPDQGWSLLLGDGGGHLSAGFALKHHWGPICFLLPKVQQGHSWALESTPRILPHFCQKDMNGKGWSFTLSCAWLNRDKAHYLKAKKTCRWFSVLTAVP